MGEGKKVKPQKEGQEKKNNNVDHRGSVTVEKGGTKRQDGAPDFPLFRGPCVVPHAHMWSSRLDPGGTLMGTDQSLGRSRHVKRFNVRQKGWRLSDLGHRPLGATEQRSLSATDAGSHSRGFVPPARQTSPWTLVRAGEGGSFDLAPFGTDSSDSGSQASDDLQSGARR
ncbi:hypothetical protein VUR80DRAFT_2005 [Thermomyces stellatus]